MSCIPITVANTTVLSPSCETLTERLKTITIMRYTKAEQSPLGEQTSTPTVFPGRIFRQPLPVVLGVALLACTVTSSQAQFSYSQNFDSMGPAGTTLPSGWTVGYLGVESSVNRAIMVPYAGNGLSITAMPVVVSDGSALPAVNVGTVLNLGSSGNSDRALGNYPRTTPSGDHVMQVALLNNSGSSVSAIQVSYWGEQWRQSQGTSTSGPELLRFLASTTDPLSGFTYFSGLDFLAPKQTTADAPVGGLDGNAAGNRVFVTGTISFQSPVPDGGTFYVRWHDWNDNGTSDHFLGIDDLQIVSVVPEPSTVSMLLLGCGALAIGWRGRRK